MIHLHSIDAPIHCINEAAVEYNIPAKLIISVLQTENGKAGEISKNKNGSYDIGPAQINSTWLPFLKKHGVTKEQVQFNPCINVKIGAWILAQSIAEENDLVIGVGNYNSHTKKFNQSYSKSVRINFTKIQILLN